jgi:hypothetical protein
METQDVFDNLATSAPSTDQPIPRADDIAGLDAAGRDYYSVSDGKFVVRRDKEVLKESTKLVGRIDRIGIERGTWKGGRNYHRLELDITTADGPAQLALDLIDPDGNFKPSVAAWQVARAFVTASFDKGAIVALQSWQGTPQKAHHKPSNNVSVYRVIGNKSDRIVSQSEKGGEWDDLEDSLRAIPCYGARPKRDDDQSGMDALVAELKGRGWPTPEENPAGWLALTTGRLKMGVKALSEIADPVWAQIAKDIANNAKPGSPMFPELQPSVPSVGSLFGTGPVSASAGSATDYDPAADE